MIPVKISEDIKTAIPKLILGCLLGKVTYMKYNKSLWKCMDDEVIRISKLPLDKIKEIPQIASSREAYKALGKEPARYRLSAEALHRRIINGKGLYQISNCVDVINLASIRTGYSIGGYDASMIKGDILFDIGRSDDVYEAIGRGLMNIESLPVFKDSAGAFGSPTSDSVRTMITEKTENILLIFLNFGGHSGFYKDLENTVNLLEEFCSAFDTEMVMYT